MVRKEFETYYNLIASDETGKILNGDSLDEISEMRNRVAIIRARVGQELALIENEIDERFHFLIIATTPISAAKREAEYEVNTGYEVSRRELKNLVHSMTQFL